MPTRDKEQVLEQPRVLLNGLSVDAEAGRDLGQVEDLAGLTGQSDEQVAKCLPLPDADQLDGISFQGLGDVVVEPSIARCGRAGYR